MYLGTLVDQTLADSTNPAAYRWSLVKGADGLNGSNGTPGANGANGQPTYVHIAYSNSPDGYADFSVDNPAGRTYVGFYVDQSVADSGNPAVYAWSLVKGADGAPGPAGPTGSTGPSADTLGLGLLASGAGTANVSSSGNTVFTLGSTTLSVQAGRSLRLNLAVTNAFYGNGDIGSVAQVDVLLGGQTIFSGIVTVEPDGSFDDTDLRAIAAQIMANPVSGSVVFAVQYRRAGPFGQSSSFRLSYSLERL